MTPSDIILETGPRQKPVPVISVSREQIAGKPEFLNAGERRWLAVNSYEGDPAAISSSLRKTGVWPRCCGAVHRGQGRPTALRSAGSAAPLPKGLYAISGPMEDAHQAVLGWVLEAYEFSRYKRQKGEVARLVCPQGVDRAAVLREAEAHYLARDLINTPSSDMGPDELEAAARAVARRFKVTVKVTKGKPLERDFPMIYAVGKASPRAPRLIDFSWGRRALPASRWSARVCASTRAASTSSRPPACCS